MTEYAKEILEGMDRAEKVPVCFRCGSKPVVDRNEALRKFIVKCPNCKDMYFSGLIIDVAFKRWNETTTWRKTINEAAAHNDKMRARGARQLPSSVEEANALNSLRK